MHKVSSLHPPSPLTPFPKACQTISSAFTHISWALWILLRKWDLTVLIVLQLAFSTSPYSVANRRASPSPTPTVACHKARTAASPAGLAPPPGAHQPAPGSRPTSRASRPAPAPAYWTKGTVALRGNRPWGTCLPGRSWGKAPLQAGSIQLQPTWEGEDRVQGRARDICAVLGG